MKLNQNSSLNGTELRPFTFNLAVLPPNVPTSNVPDATDGYI